MIYWTKTAPFGTITICNIFVYLLHDLIYIYISDAQSLFLNENHGKFLPSRQIIIIIMTLAQEKRMLNLPHIGLEIFWFPVLKLFSSKKGVLQRGKHNTCYKASRHDFATSLVCNRLEKNISIQDIQKPKATNLPRKAREIQQKIFHRLCLQGIAPVGRRPQRDQTCYAVRHQKIITKAHNSPTPKHNCGVPEPRLTTAAFR